MRCLCRTGGGSGRRPGCSIEIGTASYNVRCLPQDFPSFTIQKTGQPQAALYLVTPGTALGVATPEPYVALFDGDGVPVWWYRDAAGTPIDASLIAGGRLAWDVSTILGQQFGLPDGVMLEERRLDGTLVRTLNTTGSPTDFHEALQLSSGNFIMTTYVPRLADLTSIGVPWPTEVLDGAFQIVRPDGSVVYTWNAAGHISPAESARWSQQSCRIPVFAARCGTTSTSTPSHRTAPASSSRCATPTPSMTSAVATARSCGSSGARRPRRACRSSATRAVPLLPGELSLSTLIAAMDTMNPRAGG